MPNLQPLFRALADPTRREILTLLGKNELSVAQVASNFQMTRAAVKKHLVILADGGLIATTTRGRETLNRALPGALKPAQTWIETLDTFWDDRLTTLKSQIEKDLT